MNQKDFADLLQFPPSVVTKWKQRGWLVMLGDCEVDVEASKARLLEKRGTLDRVSKKKAKQASPWARGPNCDTRKDHESNRRFKNA